MRVRKEVLKLGKHHAQGGELDATAEWVDEKIAQAARMMGKGIRLPFIWGHQSEGWPLDPKARKDKRQLTEAKFNAGYVDKIERIDDRVFVEGEIPAVKRIDESGNLIHDVELSDGSKAEAAISEVSAGFDTWTDGKKEKHQDCLIHVALCTHPVYADQGGFALAEENRPPILLSGSTWFGTSDPIVDADSTRTELAAMADDPNKKKPAETTEKVTAEKPGDDQQKKDGGEDKPEASKPGEETPERSVAQTCQEISQYLELGLPDNMPDNAEKALEWIYIAACVKGKPAPTEELTMADAAAGSIGNPLMLSAAMKGDGAAATLAKNLDKSTRAALKSRIEALKARGVPDVKDLLDELPRLELSISPEGEVIDTHLHKTLTMLEKHLPTRKELAADSELTDAEPPATGKGDKAEQNQQTIKELEKNKIVPSARD